MQYIYYPEYELEYSGLLQKSDPPDHILNIRLLMFLCDHIILPPSHLLYTTTGNISDLITNLSDFFNAGKIVTTNYGNNIDDYFSSRIERMEDPKQKRAKEIQTDLIKENLFTNTEIRHNRSNEARQLVLFDTRVRELLADSNRFKSKSALLQSRMDSLSDQTGDAIHSNEFKRILANLSANHEISKQHSDHFMKLMSSAYYFSGTFTMDTLVSYNKYFYQIDLQNSLLRSSKNATNLIVDPYFLKSVFRIMGIDPQDICRLNVADYEKIMAHKSWENFMTIFDTLYASAQDLDTFLNHEKDSLDKLEQRKTTLFKLLNTLFYGIVIPAGLLTASPLLSIGVPLVISLLREFCSSVQKAEAFLQYNTSDRILNRIHQNRDPLYEFCFRLRSTIQKIR